jgi:hypothetical protein
MQQEFKKRQEEQKKAQFASPPGKAVKKENVVSESSDHYESDFESGSKSMTEAQINNAGIGQVKPVGSKAFTYQQPSTLADKVAASKQEDNFKLKQPDKYDGVSMKQATEAGQGGYKEWVLQRELKDSQADINIYKQKEQMLKA